MEKSIAGKVIANKINGNIIEIIPTNHNPDMGYHVPEGHEIMTMKKAMRLEERAS